MQNPENQKELLKTISKAMGKAFYDNDEVLALEVLNKYKDSTPLINNLMNYQGSDKEVEDILYGFKSRFFYTIQILLNTDKPKVKDIILKYYNSIDKFLLCNFEFKTFSENSNYVFLPQLKEELRKLVSGEIENQYSMQNLLGPIFTTPDCEIICECYPGIAKDIFPKIFDQDHWSEIYKIEMAIALKGIGYENTIIKNYISFSNQDLSASYFSTIDSLPFLKKLFLYCISSNYKRKRKFRSFMEDHLTKLNTKINHPPLQAFLDDKFLGLDWYFNKVTLENGWKFSLKMSPYIEKLQVYIPGGEVSRNVVRPNDEEQHTWMFETFQKREDLGTFACSWEIDFYLKGKDLIFFFLEAIEKIGIKKEVKKPLKKFNIDD